MEFENAKNIKIIFDNTINATQESVDLPFIYDGKPIGHIAAVYEDRIECFIYARSMKCYPEYIRRDSNLKLTAINMYLE